jgi:hypothetical protein
MPEATIGGVIQVDAGSKLFSPRIGPLSEPAARIANFDWVRYIPDFTGSPGLLWHAVTLGLARR